MASVEGLREYVREDEDSDSELTPFLEAAMLYAEGAGVERDDESPLYDLLVYMIAGHWYDNRGIVSFSTAQGKTEIPVAATALILQMREDG